MKSQVAHGCSASHGCARRREHTHTRRAHTQMTRTERVSANAEAVTTCCERKHTQAASMHFRVCACACTRLARVRVLPRRQHRPPRAQRTTGSSAIGCIFCAIICCVCALMREWCHVSKDGLPLEGLPGTRGAAQQQLRHACQESEPKTHAMRARSREKERKGTNMRQAHTTRSTHVP
jgi:hypothetical protein